MRSKAPCVRISVDGIPIYNNGALDLDYEDISKFRWIFILALVKHNILGVNLCVISYLRVNLVRSYWRVIYRSFHFRWSIRWFVMLSFRNSFRLLIRTLTCLSIFLMPRVLLTNKSQLNMVFLLISITSYPYYAGPCSSPPVT